MTESSQVLVSIKICTKCIKVGYREPATNFYALFTYFYAFATKKICNLLIEESPIRILYYATLR